MAARPVSLTWSPPPRLLGTAAVLAALLVGALTAASVPLGVGVLMALCYAPLVLINLPVGIAIWVGVVFVEHLPILSVGPNAAGLMIAVAWFGTLGSRREQIAAVFRAHRGLFGAGALLLVWQTLSIVWATDSGRVVSDLVWWYVAGLVLLVVATTVSTPRHVRLVVAAYVAGAALSVLIGVAEGALSSSGTAVDTAVASEGRLQGGGGDPNYLAAGLVPALVLAGALIGQVRDPVARILLLVTMVTLTAGLAATQSRGGLVAAVVAGIVAVAVQRRRVAAVAAVALIALTATAWFASAPAAWERVTDWDGGGTGRAELWTVGWRMFEDEPITGVGLNNFREESQRYVREPGPLEFVHLIAERPGVVHNSFLQQLAETGIVGLLLYLAAVGACLSALWRAVKRFEAAAEPLLAALSRSVIVAAAGLLAASFFLSNPTDARLWILLGLGPALYGVSRRSPSSTERPLSGTPTRQLELSGRTG